MSNKISIFVVFSFFLLCFAGCGGMMSGDVGIEPTEILELDGEFEAKVSIEKGEVVAIDVRVPQKSGYRLVGASFDPEILTMVHYLVYDDGGPRTQYMFQAMADGTTSVLIKMQPEAGGDVEIYKQIAVNVGERDTLF